MVSTKAPACPHCGTVPFGQMPEGEKLEKLADELGSMSAAVAMLESLARTDQLPPVEVPRATQQPARVYSTGDYILYSIATLPLIVLLLAGLFLVAVKLFEKPNSAAFSPSGTGVTRPDPENFR